jgi:glycosyltransferase involved in cell wall biosynthesis
MYYNCPKGMNILLIRTTGGVSGAETHNISLFRGLLREKHISVHVLTNYRPFIRRLKRNHIPSSFIFFPIKEAGTNRELLLSALWFYPMLILYIAKIKSLERGKRFDTILLESMTEKLFLSPYLKLLGYRVVWIEQGPLFATTRSWIVKKLYVYKSKWPDAILAVSHDTKKDLIRGGVKTQKIKVVYIGIRRIASPESRNDKNGRQKKWTIGFLGSVTKEKGITEFLDAAYAITQKNAYASFCVIGGGPLLGCARQYARKLKIQKNIVFTGYVEDAAKYLTKIDILFFPTHHQEGISLALLEALALGKIVVARDIGGNRELIIDKKTGFLFQAKEEGVKILEKIITGKISTREIHKNALEHIRNNFFMGKQIPRFIDIF